MDDVERLALLFRALADPARLRILGAIAEQPRSGKELAEQLKLTPPTISHHIHKLIETGLVTVTSKGTRHTYRLDERALRDAVRSSTVITSADETATDEDRECTKVLRDFFDGERLKSIPAQRKKLVLVLQHLAERFTLGEQYPERAVNEILRTAHDDFATLRRELVDYGFMRRDHGIYEVAQAPPERSAQVAQEFIGDERAWFERLVSGATRQVLRGHDSD